jgi:aryl-alcohol dehydrogenase-like predicted oxidoreductase
MQYRDLGATGLRVSEIGLGCGPLGHDPEADYAPLLERALELGVNFFDTADFYAQSRSEEWLGKVLSSRRDQVVLATKFGTVRKESGELGKDWSVANMRRALEGSLRRLRTDYIDLYQLHSPPPSVLDSDDLLAALQELKEAGKIRFYGISLDDGRFGIDAIRRWNVDAIQIMFNLFHQEPAETFFPAAAEAGVGVIVKVPLDSGMLGGDLGPGSDRKFDDPRERWGGDLTARRQRLIDELRFLTEGTGRTIAQAALQFVLSFDAVSTAIPGTVSIDHLEEDIAASGGRLSVEEIARLRSLLDGDFGALNLGW